ncbi:hypothetical protein [Saccharibacillus sacchari]|uniref:Uncharacterized protein n=1 Tax=Saccharibacillus sacchari TaxID=456493 RepID=A0ACC6PFR6_9BACL
MSKAEHLYEAIGEADDELLERLEKVMALRQSTGAIPANEEEARSATDRKKRRTLWSAAAASLLVAAAAILLVVNGGLFDLGKSAVYTASGPVIDRPADNLPGGGTAPGMTAAPQNGETVYDEAVRAAVENNADPQTEYFVAIDLFASGIPLEADSAEVKSELKRLLDLGLNVGYAEAWAYEGAGEQKPYRYAAGFLTAQQLEQLQPSDSYGYALRFATNGDGTPVSADNGIRTDLN